MEIDINTSHPNPQPSSHHRKIELQSPLDLLYLQENLANIARSKLDLHFPPIPTSSKPATVIALGGPTPQASNKDTDTQPQPESETEPDPLRVKVQDYITEFLQTTWSTAQQNLTLNGLDASTTPTPPSAILSATKPLTQTDPSPTIQSIQDPPPEIEGKTFTYTPFDPRLQQRVATLYADLERLTAEVSSLRRSAPRSGARKLQASLDAALAADDDLFTTSTSPTTLAKDAENNVPVFASAIHLRDSWTDDARTHYGDAVTQLHALAGVSKPSSDSREDEAEIQTETRRIGKKRNADVGASLTETMGRVQRARTVAMEME